MLLRSPGPISPDTYSGHIRRRALCPNRLRNGMSQRSSSSCQSDILPTMVGPSKSRPPMSHRKTDLGIPCRSKSAKVVLDCRSHPRFGEAGCPQHEETLAEVIPPGERNAGLIEAEKNFQRHVRAAGDGDRGTEAARDQVAAAGADCADESQCGGGLDSGRLHREHPADLARTLRLLALLLAEDRRNHPVG